MASYITTLTKGTESSKAKLRQRVKAKLRKLLDHTSVQERLTEMRRDDARRLKGDVRRLAKECCENDWLALVVHLALKGTEKPDWLRLVDESGKREKQDHREAEARYDDAQRMSRFVEKHLAQMTELLLRVDDAINYDLLEAEERIAELDSDDPLAGLTLANLRNDHRSFLQAAIKRAKALRRPQPPYRKRRGTHASPAAAIVRAFLVLATTIEFRGSEESGWGRRRGQTVFNFICGSGAISAGRTWADHPFPEIYRR